MGARNQHKFIDQQARNHLAQNLARLRARQPLLSDRQFFAQIPVPRSTLRHVMAATIGVSLDTLSAIAADVHLPVWMLLVPDLDPEALPSLTYKTQAPIRTVARGAAAPPVPPEKRKTPVRA